MSKNMRQWKAAAEAAIASAHFERERQRVPAEVAARAAALGLGSLAVLPGLDLQVAGVMNDAWLRAALAARYLDTLQDGLSRAEYEDTRSLAAKLAWTERYFSAALQAPLLGRLEWLTQGRTELRETWSERLFSALALQIAPQLTLRAAIGMALRPAA